MKKQGTQPLILGSGKTPNTYKKTFNKLMQDGPNLPKRNAVVRKSK